MVSEDIAATTEKQNEGSRCQRVSGDEPAENATVFDTEAVADDFQGRKVATNSCLSHELGHANDEHEGYFSDRTEFSAISSSLDICGSHSGFGGAAPGGLVVEG